VVAACSIAFLWRARAAAGSGVGASALDGLLALGPTLVVLGIIFGDDRLVGYSFIGAGVVVAVVAAVYRSRTPRL